MFVPHTFSLTTVLFLLLLSTKLCPVGFFVLSVNYFTLNCCTIMLAVVARTSLLSYTIGLFFNQGVDMTQVLFVVNLK